MLAVVLWLLLAIAVAIGFGVQWTQERLREARLARDDVESEFDVLSARETLLFLAATVPSTLAGQPLEPMGEDELVLRRLDDFGGFDRSPRGGELLLDGTPYAGPGGVTFRLQDEAGLVPVLQPADSALPRLLAALGVPAAQQRRLTDIAADYVDLDVQRRSAGAEMEEYARIGLPAPPGRFLLHPRELGRLPEWRDLDPSLRERLFPWLTTSYSGALNLNTAPVDLLIHLLPSCGEICRARLHRRHEQPFLSVRQFEEETGVRLPGDRDVDYRLAPSTGWRLTFTAGSGRAWNLHVRLTPLADRAAPWAIDAAYRSPRPDSDDSPRTPPIAFLASPSVARP